MSVEWCQVAFPNESCFMLHQTDGHGHIRSKMSVSKHHATIVGRVQVGGESIMVWRMFLWHSLGALIIVEGMMD